MAFSGIKETVIRASSEPSPRLVLTIERLAQCAHLRGGWRDKRGPVIARGLEAGLLLHQSKKALSNTFAVLHRSDVVSRPLRFRGGGSGLPNRFSGQFDAPFGESGGLSFCIKPNGRFFDLHRQVS